MDIVLRDKNGKIKQDLKVSRSKIAGRIVEIDPLRKRIKRVQKQWMNPKSQITKKKL